MIKQIAWIEDAGTDDPVIAVTATKLTLRETQLLINHLTELIIHAEQNMPVVADLMGILETANSPEDTLEDMAVAVARAGYRRT